MAKILLSNDNEHAVDEGGDVGEIEHGEGKRKKITRKRKRKRLKQR